MKVNTHENEAITAALAPVERAVLALNSTQIQRDLMELATKHATITEIKDTTGRDQCHRAAMEVKKARAAIAQAAKDARDDATQFSKAVIAEEKRLIALIEPEENRLLGLRNGWDAEQERIKAEAEAKERARVEAIQDRINAIAAFENTARQCRTAAATQRIMESLSKTDMTGMDEFDDQAQHTFTTAQGAIQQMIDTRTAEEAERDRIKAEQEAEAARLAAERVEIERLRVQAEEAAKARREAEAAKARIEAQKLAEERAALDAARAEFEQRQRAHDEAKQVEAAEAVNPASEPGPQGPSHILIDNDGEVPLIGEHEPFTPTAHGLICGIASEFHVTFLQAQAWLVLRADEIKTAE